MSRARARAGVKPHGLGAAPRAPPKPRPANDVPSRPPPPEPQRIIEPGQDPSASTGDWDPKSPMYKSLVQQVVGKISTAPHPTEGDLKARRGPELPSDRHTGVNTGLMEGAPAAARGRLTIAQLREVLREQHAARPGGADPRALAGRYSVDAAVLERALRHVSLVKELERELPS